MRTIAWLLATVVLAGILLIWMISRTSPPAEMAGWQWRAVLPTARGEMKAAVLGGKIFVPGGLTGLGRSTAVLEIYDPASDTWRRGPDMPQGLNHHAVVALNERIYVLGGNSVILRDPPGRAVYAYNPQSGSWERRAPLPVGRWGHDAVAVSGRIYVVGGVSDGENRSILIYDPDADRWSVGAPMTSAREHLMAAAADDRIIAAGGRWQGKVLDTVEIYDPSTDRWAPGTPMPTARSAAAAGVVDGRLHVLGGEDPAAFRGRIFQQHEVYDVAADRWISLGRDPLPRHGTAAVVLGGRLFVIGGATRQGAWSVLTWSNAVGMYTPPPAPEP